MPINTLLFIIILHNYILLVKLFSGYSMRVYDAHAQRMGRLKYGYIGLPRTTFYTADEYIVVSVFLMVFRRSASGNVLTESV